MSAIPACLLPPFSNHAVCGCCNNAPGIWVMSRRDDADAV